MYTINLSYFVMQNPFANLYFILQLIFVYNVILKHFCLKCFFLFLFINYVFTIFPKK